jgi:hypothetical protein
VNKFRGYFRTTSAGDLKGGIKKEVVRRNKIANTV